MKSMTVLHRYGGIATARHMSLAHVGARELTSAVRDGRILRPRRGIYALPTMPSHALEAVRMGGRLSCVSAARSYGLWGGVDGRLHLRVPPHATRLPPGDAVRHWVGGDDHDECWRVSLADCLRSVVRCAPAETAVAVLDTALSAGLATVAGLARIFEDEPARPRSIAACARPGSDSGVESIMRQRLEARGHIVEQQVHVSGVGRVDMRVDGLLYVELDGFAYHSGRAAFERDRLRDTALALAGGRRLRVSAVQVLEHGDDAIATIEALLAAPEIRPMAPLW
jgi:very-short-patch-repair endonuclease